MRGRARHRPVFGCGALLGQAGVPLRPGYGCGVRAVRRARPRSQRRARRRYGWRCSGRCRVVPCQGGCRAGFRAGRPASSRPRQARRTRAGAALTQEDSHRRVRSCDACSRHRGAHRRRVPDRAVDDGRPVPAHVSHRDHRVPGALAGSRRRSACLRAGLGTDRCPTDVRTHGPMLPDRALTVAGLTV